MSPIPDAVAGPPEPEHDPQYWSKCPGCGSSEHTFNTPGLYEIYQVCTNCGLQGETNHHFMAELAGRVEKVA